jgi:hypothetical protein
MDITKEFLQEEIAKMEAQRNHAHDVAVASQAAVDTMKALLMRLDAPNPVEKDLTLAALDLPDPLPIQKQED